MSTWSTFYIKTTRKDDLIHQLKTLSGIRVISEAAFPKDFKLNHLLDEKANPSCLLIGNTQSDWITVVHNSFSKLYDWGFSISKTLDTQLIITGAQSASSYYYFCLYEKGNKIREIEYCYSEDFEPVNYGDKFLFEGEQPGIKEESDGEIEYYFGFDEIESYCKYFGLEIQLDYGNISWKILKSEKQQVTINDYIAKLTAKKPWWKFW